jgi:hypothetical protein
MMRRRWTRARRRRLGSALVAFGLLVWAVSLSLHLTARDNRDVSISYFEERSLGVISGGASVVAGIILLATAV